MDDLVSLSDLKKLIPTHLRELLCLEAQDIIDADDSDQPDRPTQDDGPSHAVNKPRRSHRNQTPQCDWEDEERSERRFTRNKNRVSRI